MKVDRSDQIKRLLLRGLNYSQVGKELGLSRQRMSQLVQTYRLSHCRRRVPKGYWSIREFAVANGLHRRNVVRRVGIHDLPAIKVYDQWYIAASESYRCRTCGGKIVPLDSSHRIVCDACRQERRDKAHWRYWYRKSGRELLPCLAYTRKPSERGK